MGTPKAVLPGPDSRPFVVRIAGELLSAGVPEVVVITGRHHEAVAEALADWPIDGRVRVVRNPDPDRGQLSSLLVGLDATLVADPEGILVTLVDVPLVRASVVRRVVEAWQRSRAPIVRPAIGSHHGHPVIFDRSVFPELRSARLDLGAKVVVRAHAHDLVDVPVEDDGCLIDVDTPDDYEAFKARLSTRRQTS